jgi:hypothetical protein
VVLNRCQSTVHRKLTIRHTLPLPEQVRVDIGLFLRTCVQLLFEQGLDYTAARGSLGAATREDAGALNSERLVHDGASSSGELQVRNGPATGGPLDGGGHGAKGRSRGLLQERAHALGLAQKRLHGEVQLLVRMRKRCDEEGKKRKGKERKKASVRSYTILLENPGLMISSHAGPLQKHAPTRREALVAWNAGRLFSLSDHLSLSYISGWFSCRPNCAGWAGRTTDGHQLVVRDKADLRSSSL